MRSFRVGSRESPLALMQSHQVIAQIQQAWPDLQIELKTFKTKGDIVLDTSLSKIGDKGLFVKELEEAIYRDEIDLAVHSLKDLPGLLPTGLAIQSVGEREDPRDVLLSTEHVRFKRLPPNAVVGTSSLRRIAHFTRLRPDLEYRNIRGNLQTRVSKQEEGQYQAIILAAAGVHRLGWQTRITQYFDPIRESVPAVGQGILAVEYREDDTWVIEKLATITKPRVQAAMAAERSFLLTLEGGCQVPIGAYAQPNAAGDFTLYGTIMDIDGSHRVQGDRTFQAEDAVLVGRLMAENLLRMGGEKILKRIRATVAPT